MGSELTDRTIAAEAGLVERTVSFTKGCYTGQELVARLEARGTNVPRRLVGVVGGSDAEGERLAFGMTLHAASAAGAPAPGADDVAADKVVGTVTSAAWSPELGAWAALAYLHRSVPSPGPVRVRSGDGVGGAQPAQVAPLPLVDLVPLVDLTRDPPAEDRALPSRRAARRGDRLLPGCRGHDAVHPARRRPDGPGRRGHGRAGDRQLAAAHPDGPVPDRAPAPAAPTPTAPGSCCSPSSRCGSWSTTRHGSRAAHPTFSSITDAVNRFYLLKAALFLGWLVFGLSILRQGAGRGRFAARRSETGRHAGQRGEP